MSSKRDIEEFVTLCHAPLYKRDIERDIGAYRDMSRLASICVQETSMRKPRLSKPIFFRQGQWAVTSYGLECTEREYAVEHRRLWQNGRNKPLDLFDGRCWAGHIGQKDWVNRWDLVDALIFARTNYDRLWVKRPRTFIPVDLRDVREDA